MCWSFGDQYNYLRMFITFMASTHSHLATPSTPPFVSSSCAGEERGSSSRPQQQQVLPLSTPMCRVDAWIQLISPPRPLTPVEARRVSPHSKTLPYIHACRRRFSYSAGVRSEDFPPPLKARIKEWTNCESVTLQTLHPFQQSHTPFDPQLRTIVHCINKCPGGS